MIVYGMWGVWLAGRVARSCDELDGTIDDALAEFMGPQQWVVCVAEVLSMCAAQFDEEWPMEDAELFAYVRAEGSPDVVAFDVSGMLLVRASDRALCVTLGHGSVAEPYGGGLTVNRAPALERYSEAWQLPVTTYMGADF